MMGYCIKERKQVEIKDPEQVTMSNGRPAVRGVCPDCGTNIFKIGSLEVSQGGEFQQKPAEEPPPETILDEAKRIVDGPRIKAYGHPLDDFSRTAAILTALFRDKLEPNSRFAPEDIPLIMIAIKLSRQTNSSQRDNMVDIAGYARTAEKVVERLEEQGVARPPGWQDD